MIHISLNLLRPMRKELEADRRWLLYEWPTQRPQLFHSSALEMWAGVTRQEPIDWDLAMVLLVSRRTPPTPKTAREKKKKRKKAAPTPATTKQKPRR